MSQARLHQHAFRWMEKPVLREIYTDFYRRIVSSSVCGRTLEIGGGTGNLKEFLPEVFSTDIIHSPWLDCVCDGQRLPFKDASMDNVVGIDILHHIERPAYFFQEASRVLRPGGRLILLDPAITMASYLFYKFFHEEDVDLTQDPLEEGSLSFEKDPFSANQAIPTLIFKRCLDRLGKVVPHLHLVEKEFISLWCYPLSGGFRSWTLIPKRSVKSLLFLERHLEKYLGPIFGFRLYVVMEKT